MIAVARNFRVEGDEAIVFVFLDSAHSFSRIWERVCEVDR